MRSIIALLATFIILFASVSFAESTQESSFQDSLGDWIQDLNLDQKDYNLVLRTQSNAYQAAIRKSDTLYELELGKLGTLQLNSNALVLRTPEQTYSFPYGELVSQFRSLVSSAELEKDSSALSKYAVKFWADVISPSVTFRMNRHGISGSIDINDMDLTHRIICFVDDMLNDHEFCERFLTRYGRVLKTLSLPVPDSMEDIRTIWQQEKAHYVAEGYSFRVKTDYTFTRDDSGTHFSLFGNVDTLYQDITPFEITGNFTSESWNMQGNVLGSQIQTTFHLEGSGDTWTGSANLYFPQSFGNHYSVDIKREGYQYTGELQVLPSTRYIRRNSQLDRTVFRASGEYDPELNQFTGHVVQIVESPEPETTELLTLDAKFQRDAFSASLAFPDQTVEIALRSSQTGLHATADIIQGLVANHFSLLFNHFEDRYSFYAAYQDRSRFRFPLNYSIDLDCSSTSFNLDFCLPDSPYHHQLFRIQGSYKPAEDGFDLDFHLTKWSYASEYFKEIDNPISLKLQKRASGIHVEINNVFQNRNLQDSTVVDIQYDSNRIAKASGSMTRQMSPYHTEKLCFDYLPSSLILSLNDDTIHILKESETANEIVFQIQQNRKPELFHLTMAFQEADAGKTFLLTLSTPAEELFSCQIVPNFKGNPAAIDDSNAIVLHDPVQFSQILMDLWKSQGLTETASIHLNPEETNFVLPSPSSESMRTALVQGYSSIITVQAEIADNTIKALHIDAPDENPDHGKWVEEPEFAEQFLDRTLPISEDSIDCISGATVSSRAVVKALNSLAVYPAPAAGGEEKKVTAQGFAGDVVVNAVLDGNTIQSLSIQAPDETEGLGKKAEEAEFAAQFVGKTLPVSISDIDAIAGATITTTAVVDALNSLAVYTELVPTEEAPAVGSEGKIATAHGFAGDVVINAVLDGDTILSLSIQAPDETVGLGKWAEDAEFAAQFIGKTLPVSISDIDAIAGATITTTAVLDALNSLAPQPREITVPGYGGDITISVYVKDNMIQSLTVSAPSETEGLGKKAETPEFTDQFIGMTLPVATDKVEAISGATVTSNAVIKALNQYNTSTVTVPGFGGDITVRAEIIDGTIQSLSVSAPAETPELGKKAEDAAFTDQFTGKTLPVSLDDIDAITGATITTQAVVDALNSLNK